MATNRLRLVQGDNAPQLIIGVYDTNTLRPLNLSSAGASFRVLFRQLGELDVKSIMPAYPIAGFTDPNTGEEITGDPYDTPGRGGRLVMDWSDDALDTTGSFQGELEITQPGGRIMTVYDIMKFIIRAQF